MNDEEFIESIEKQIQAVMDVKIVNLSFTIRDDLQAELERLASWQARRPVDLLREELYRADDLLAEPQEPGSIMLKFRITEEQRDLIDKLAEQAKVNRSEACRRLVAAVVTRYGRKS